MPAKPNIFIGSSSEGGKIAEAIQYNLREVAQSQIWNQAFIRPSDHTSESIFNALSKFDFAIFVLSADDKLESRGARYKVPRDNVIFEIGLFMGRLGKSRVYMIGDNDPDLRIPSDLLGITTEKFDMPDNEDDLIHCLGPATTALKIAIRKLGPRQPAPASKDNYKVDLETIVGYLKDKGHETISFKTLNIYNRKYTEEYVNKIVEHFPDRLRRTRLDGEKELGIKVLNFYGHLIWKDDFKNWGPWVMNFWGSKDPQKTNRIEKGRMIFEALPEELDSPDGRYGAFIDIHDGIVKGKRYDVQCEVRSTENTTMGFQLWIHDGKVNSTADVLLQSYPIVPTIKYQTFKLRFTANETEVIRIHLYCKGGTGMIRVSEVSIFQVD